MIYYQSLIDKAMLGVIKKILKDVENQGLIEDQHFYISFRTDHPDLVLSDKIKSRYTEELTIVLQYQFQDLSVLKSSFCVNISFGGVSEYLEIPFSSINTFADPSKNFVIHFEKENISKSEYAGNKLIEGLSKFEVKKSKQNKIKEKSQQKGKIIFLDKFKKGKE